MGKQNDGGGTDEHTLDDGAEIFGDAGNGKGQEERPENRGSTEPIMMAPL